jgi:hypothetical protein
LISRSRGMQGLASAHEDIKPTKTASHKGLKAQRSLRPVLKTLCVFVPLWLSVSVIFVS